MRRSESDVVEVVVDRMYQEKVRFGSLDIAEKVKSEDVYKVE